MWHATQANPAWIPFVSELSQCTRQIPLRCPFLRKATPYIWLFLYICRDPDPARGHAPRPSPDIQLCVAHAYVEIHRWAAGSIHRSLHVQCCIEVRCSCAWASRKHDGSTVRHRFLPALLTPSRMHTDKQSHVISLRGSTYG